MGAGGGWIAVQLTSEGRVFSPISTSGLIIVMMSLSSKVVVALEFDVFSADRVGNKKELQVQSGLFRQRMRTTRWNLCGPLQAGRIIL